MRTRYVYFATLALAVLVLGSQANAGTDKHHDGQLTVDGSVHTFSAGLTRGYDISGDASLTRDLANGATIAAVTVDGLAPDTSYGVHVHNAPCAAGGGGHYQDLVGGPVDANNELWPRVTTDATGHGEGYAAVDWVARGEAQSIVIHDSDGARIACSDLGPGEVSKIRGALSTFSAGLTRGFDISGDVTIERTGDATRVTVKAAGLAPDSSYGVHVHNAPCAAGGGGHYQDLVGGPVDAINEIWPRVTTGPNGKGHGNAEVAWVARAEAQSVVIHDSDGARIACADLIVGR